MEIRPHIVCVLTAIPLLMAVTNGCSGMSVSKLKYNPINFSLSLTYTHKEYKVALVHSVSVLFISIVFVYKSGPADVC